MRYYPLMLNLAKTKVFILGAGEVARRKATDIIACAPAELRWVDPRIPPEDLPRELVFAHGVVYAQRQMNEDDLAGCSIVFACTNSKAGNRLLAQSCRSHNILCNVIDAPEEGSFIVPAHFHAGDFILALATGGSSPALARHMRMELQTWFGEKYAPLLLVLGKLRPLVLALGQPTEQNTALFRNVVNSDLATALAAKDTKKALNLLKTMLPDTLHTHIGELLHESL